MTATAPARRPTPFKLASTFTLRNPDCHLSPSERIALLSLCSRMSVSPDDAFVCFPHTKQLAADLGVKKRHAWGLLETIQRKYPGLLKYDPCPKGARLETRVKGRGRVKHSTPRWTWLGDTAYYAVIVNKRELAIDDLWDGEDQPQLEPATEPAKQTQPLATDRVETLVKQAVAAWQGDPAVVVLPQLHREARRMVNMASQPTDQQIVAALNSTLAQNAARLNRSANGEAF